MRAQRVRCNAVNSYKGECALVPPLIRADEFTFHESGVCVERIRRFRAGVGINGRSTEPEISLTHKPFKVGYCRWITTFSVGAGSIRGNGRTIDRARKIEVQRAEGPSRRVGYRQGDATFGLIVVILIILIVAPVGPHWRPEP